MKRICAICAAAMLATPPAMAGDYWRHDGCVACGPGGWNAYPNGNGYGRQPNGSYGYFAPTPYGYYTNGGNGYAPPPKPPVMVEPFACERHEMIFIPRFNRYICKPVAVPRY
jgi:hypothetical protein